MERSYIILAIALVALFAPVNKGQLQEAQPTAKSTSDVRNICTWPQFPCKCKSMFKFKLKSKCISLSRRIERCAIQHRGLTSYNVSTLCSYEVQCIGDIRQV